MRLPWWPVLISHLKWSVLRPWPCAHGHITVCAHYNGRLQNVSYCPSVLFAFTSRTVPYWSPCWSPPTALKCTVSCSNSPTIMAIRMLGWAVSTYRYNHDVILFAMRVIICSTTLWNRGIGDVRRKKKKSWIVSGIFRISSSFKMFFRQN